MTMMSSWIMRTLDKSEEGSGCMKGCMTGCMRLRRGGRISLR